MAQAVPVSGAEARKALGRQLAQRASGAKHPARRAQETAQRLSAGGFGSPDPLRDVPQVGRKRLAAQQCERVAKQCHERRIDRARGAQVGEQLARLEIASLRRNRNPLPPGPILEHAAVERPAGDRLRLVQNFGRQYATEAGEGALPRTAMRSKALADLEGSSCRRIEAIDSPQLALTRLV